MSIITTLLSLIATIVPVLTDSAQIANVISTLTQIITAGVEEIETVAPFIKNIIAALQSNSAITADQMTQLQQLDAQTDAAFEAAATADGIPASTSS